MLLKLKNQLKHQPVYSARCHYHRYRQYIVTVFSASAGRIAASSGRAPTPPPATREGEGDEIGGGAAAACSMCRETHGTVRYASITRHDHDAMMYVSERGSTGGGGGVAVRACLSVDRWRVLQTD